MASVDIRVDPSDGCPYTFPEIAGWYRDQGWDMPRIQRYWSTLPKFEIKKPELRFSQGDRVLCNMGVRRLPGVVLSLNVEDPEDPTELVAYVVKTDNLLGVAPSNTISAPCDEDFVICRDRCFNSESETDLTKWAAPLKLDRNKPLRFSVGDGVAIRVNDRDDGYEQWMDGCISEVWPSLPYEKEEDSFLKSAEAVPYKVSLQGNPNQTFYCHRDDHTLIRKPENKPRTSAKTISKRFEKRKLDNGLIEKFDHVTLRGKIVEEEDSDSE